MSGKTMKLLRKGSKKFNLPYDRVKRAFKHLNNPVRSDFLEEAREGIYER